MSCSLPPCVGSCIVGREGDLRGRKGPPNSFGSSCIRLNGTNYKSRAISPHYSERTRKGKKRGGGLFNSQWEIEGRERKAESDFIRKTDMKTTLENEIRKRRGKTEGCGTGWMVSENPTEEGMEKTGRWRELGKRAQEIKPKSAA